MRAFEWDVRAPEVPSDLVLRSCVNITSRPWQIPGPLAEVVVPTLLHRLTVVPSKHLADSPNDLLAIGLGERTIELHTPLLEPQLSDLPVGTTGDVPTALLVLILILDGDLPYRSAIRDTRR
jgi:hypothetical protein